MSALSGLLTALVGIASSPLNLVMIVFCTLYGIIMGAIPGVSAFMALILFLPLTYRMSTELALVCLYAVMTGGVSGGLISSILLNIPGTPGAR
jgi:putative tricarboxylic transport membrane protein